MNNYFIHQGSKFHTTETGYEIGTNATCICILYVFPKQGKANGIKYLPRGTAKTSPKAIAMFSSSFSRSSDKQMLLSSATLS